LTVALPDDGYPKEIQHKGENYIYGAEANESKRAIYFLETWMFS
jgi:hypothetical protein